MTKAGLITLLFSVLAFGAVHAASVMDIPVAKVPPSAGKPASRALPTRESLIGGKAKKLVLTSDDVRVMEPVCVLILSTENDGGGFWFPRLKNDPIFNRPEYAIARGVSSYHHYCWAEVARYRYYRARDAMARNDMAQMMIDDIQFVINKRALLPPGWPYMPKMYVALGEGYLMANKVEEGVRYFQRALEEDPKYAPAYHAIADLWRRMGDGKRALEAVERGLKVIPDNMGLRKRYVEFGGKAPLPALTPKPAAKSAETEAEQAARQAAAAAAKAAQTPQAVAPRPVRAEPAEPVDEQRKANPWCRFCPW